MNDIEKKDKLMAYFYKHIVPIYFCFEKGDKKHQFILTSFVLSVSDHWFLITAGHSFYLIREELIHKGWTLAKCSLVDSLGINAKFDDPIPFPFDINKGFFFPGIDKEDYSFDYGFYPLSEYFKKMLVSNNVEPLNEEVWKKQPENVDLSVLIGIPSELINYGNDIDIISCLIYADIVEVKPARFKDVSLPQIYAKIQFDNEIKSIEGMSGGPFFGFKIFENGEMRYWLLGLQSRWLPKSKCIAICPIQVFGLMLESFISESHL
jgi:hypothetical protein